MLRDWAVQATRLGVRVLVGFIVARIGLVLRKNQKGSSEGEHKKEPPLTKGTPGE
jgi:hypothetical protein